MIGTIEIQVGKRQIRANLNDDGTWESDDTPLEIALNTGFMVEECSPADGMFGVSQLHTAAAKFDGKVIKEPDNSDTSDEKVY